MKTPQYDKKGYTVEGTVDIIKQRKSPSSNPGTDDNMSYQDMPWGPKERDHEESDVDA